MTTSRSDLAFRLPTVADSSRIEAIDAEGLATGHASFRAEPYHWTRFREAFLAGRGVARVAEGALGVVGWAGVSPSSARMVYLGVGETSIYVSAAARGTGVGRALLAALIEASEQAGYWTLVAQIFPENGGSLALHHALGFRTVGLRHRLGRMDYGPMRGCWRDVAFLERRSEVVGGS